MDRRNFVHLHVHTEYSLLDGASRIRDLVKQVKALGMPAIAVTDHGVMYGVLDFYKAARSEGIKPVIGCEVYMAQRTLKDRVPQLDDSPHHLVLLAETETGYRNLLKLVSAGFLEGFYYKPRIDRELLSRHREGLICLSGCLAGEIPQLLLENRDAEAAAVAGAYAEIMGPGAFYLELQNHFLPGQEVVNKGLVRLSRELGIPLVATNDLHYIHKSDAQAHDVLLCIQTGKNIRDQDRLRFPTPEFYLKTTSEMYDLFGELPEALENTLAIAERCHVELRFDQVYLPEYTRLPEGHTPDSYLERLCLEGLERRFPAPDREVVEKLKYELSVIKKMGYANYFLIVWDFIRFARSRGIPVGPGRGSVAGSLVAYVLGITSVDPLKYGLVFERFLNPERISLPDIDVDFCFERRGEVIDYVVDVYGADRVAQIIAFGTMAARAAIRDVGRALDMPYAEVDRIAKMVPFEVGMTIDRAREDNPELRQMYEADEEVRLVLDTARALEGLPRHASIHAAGVVISRDPLVDHVPLQKTPEGAVITHFSMELLEEIGLLKMDFLGLRTLTVLAEATRAIQERHGVALDLDNLSLDDEETFALLGDGDTMGVFQLESSGMRDLLRRLKPDSFADLIHLIALYRPGPLGRAEEFVQGKHGLRSISYPHPRLEAILKETYGVMVYQEQVMRVVSELAGFTLAEADLLRRAIAKKKGDVLTAQREEFIRRAVANGVDLKVAGEVFDVIVPFAQYGFNKSHAAAYALIAYQTAYLKANFPLEYMAALLTSVMGNTERVAAYIEECRRMGIRILPPDINESLTNFTVAGKNIRFGLAAVKNVGKNAIEGIIEARNAGGPFKSLGEFCERVNLHVINKRVIESLIKCGGFDSLGAHRAQLLQGLDRLLERAQALRKEKQNGQVSFIDLLSRGGGFVPAAESLPEVEPFPHSKILSMEKETLGFYISGHPLADYRLELGKQVTATNSGLRELQDGTRVVIGGLIANCKRIRSRSGDPMMFLSLEDLEGSVEVVVVPSVYERCRQFARKDSIVLVKGRVNLQDEEVKVICDEILPVSTSKLIIKLFGAGAERKNLESLRGILMAHRGNVPVYLDVADARRRVLAGERYWVTGEQSLVDEIEQLLGPGTVELEGAQDEVPW